MVPGFDYSWCPPHPKDYEVEVREVVGWPDVEVVYMPGAKEATDETGARIAAHLARELSAVRLELSDLRRAAALAREVWRDAEMIYGEVLTPKERLAKAALDVALTEEAVDSARIRRADDRVECLVCGELHRGGHRESCGCSHCDPRPDGMGGS
jgi:hypothetical protein